MGRNVNKKPNLRARHFQQIHFSVIFLHAWITIFGSFSYLREYVSLLKYGKNVRCKQFWPKRYRHSIFKNVLVSKSLRNVIFHISCTHIRDSYLHPLWSIVIEYRRYHAWESVREGEGGIAVVERHVDVVVWRPVQALNHALTCRGKDKCLIKFISEFIFNNSVIYNFPKDLDVTFYMQRILKEVLLDKKRLSIYEDFF